MKILEVAITVRELDTAAAFYRDVLGMPVEELADRVIVTAGFSRLVMTAGEHFDGVHHVAFGIAPHDFDRARTWLKDRVDLTVAGGSDVFAGPPGWDSRSVYFPGPEDIVLEFIARDADAEVPRADGVLPRPFSISEIGVSVPDTKAAVGELTDGLGVPTFPPQQADFAPLGDHDGLLIVVDQARAWFPAYENHASDGPLTVRLDAPDQPAHITLTHNTTITAG